jgi:hypothetical protein
MAARDLNHRVLEWPVVFEERILEGCTSAYRRRNLTASEKRWHNQLRTAHEKKLPNHGLAETLMYAFRSSSIKLYISIKETLTVSAVEPRVYCESWYGTSSVP